MKHLSETRKDGDALGTFYGVGLGPGDPELITWKALKILQKADRIYTAVSRQSERSVSGAVIAALPEICAPAEELRFSMSGDWTERRNCIDAHAGRIAEELKNGLDCVFGTIGDPMTYSTCSYLLHSLKQRLPGLRSVMVPGVNSWSALAAEIQTPLTGDTEILRIVPEYEPGDSSLEFPENSTTVLLKIHRTRNELLEKLPADAEVCYGAKIGLPDEILCREKERIASLPETYLSMLTVKRRKQHD